MEFDADAYYAEQEERMNIPDETVDEFMKRVSTFRRSQGSNAYTTSSRVPYSGTGISMEEAQSADIVIEAAALVAPSCISAEHSNIESPIGSGRNMNRKASDLQQVEASAADKRRRVANQDNGSEIALDPPETSPSPQFAGVQKSDKDPQQRERTLEAEVEDIDSFTLDVCDVQIPAKRKILPTRQSPRKKRLVAQNRSPQGPSRVAVADHSPISSFSRSVLILPRKAPIARKEGLAPIPKNPPLDFRPLHEVDLARQSSKNKTKHASPPAEPFISPIEESSLHLPPESPTKKRALTAEASDLYLEVKERIAKHTSTKNPQRDKVAKLSSKPVLAKSMESKSAVAQHESAVIYVSSSPSSRASSPAPDESGDVNLKAKGEQKQKQKQKPQEIKTARPVAAKRKTKGKKEKPPPMTPVQYAQMLQDKVAAASAVPKVVAEASTSKPVPQRKRTLVRFLEGKNIFYHGGDLRTASESTRAKMDIIVKFGGNLMPKYDPKVTTHIVTDAALVPTLNALGVKRLSEIPDHIPTVTWEWVLTVLGRESSLSKEEIERKLGDTIMSSAFSSRIDIGRPKISKSAAFFRIKRKETFLEDAGNVNAGPVASTSKIPAQSSPSPSSGTESDAPSYSMPPIGAPLSPPTSPIRPDGPSKTQEAKFASTLDRKDEKGKQPPIHDPLTEFYDQARLQKQQADDGWSSLGEFDAPDTDDDETDDEHFVQEGPIPRKKRGWTCDKKEPQREGDCPNQDIIDKLTELMQLHKAKLGDGDNWRAFSYSKSIRALKNHPRRIKSVEEARSIRGVGEKTAKKIEEILQTGELRRIKYEKTKDVEVTQLFQGIYGVGQSIAFQWYSAGCRTLDDLKTGKGGVKLSQVQQIGLKYYDDINDRMPRAEAKAIFDLIKPIALAIDLRLFVEIMGSYRRGKADCGDIDILISRPTDDGKTHSGIIPRLLRDLHVAGILTEDLALPDDSYDLETTYRGLCRLPGVKGATRRRIDILCVPWTSKGAALLYYTGDDIFNRAMRMKANVLGYSLNQKGLFGNVVRDPRDRRIKMNVGVLVASETEEEIFKILGVPWQEPHERVRG